MRSDDEPLGMNPMYRRVAIVLVLVMVIALLGGFFASVGRTATTACTDSSGVVAC